MISQIYLPPGPLLTSPYAKYIHTFLLHSILFQFFFFFILLYRSAFYFLCSLPFIGSSLVCTRSCLISHSLKLMYFPLWHYSFLKAEKAFISRNLFTTIIREYWNHSNQQNNVPVFGSYSNREEAQPVKLNCTVLDSLALALDFV